MTLRQQGIHVHMNNLDLYFTSCIKIKLRSIIGVPVVVQWLTIRLVSMKMQVQSLALLSG